MRNIFVWCAVFCVSFLVMSSPVRADGPLLNNSVSTLVTGSSMNNYGVNCSPAQPIGQMLGCAASFYEASPTYSNCQGTSYVVPTAAAPSGSVTVVCAGGGGGISGQFSPAVTFHSLVCPVNSTAVSGVCTCGAGWVPSPDSSSCVSGVPRAEVKYGYALETGTTVCTADGVCGGGLVYNSASAACQSYAVNYSNSSTQCTLVQGRSCVCSTTFSNGDPPNMQVFPVLDLVPCPPDDLICGAAKEQLAESADTVSDAAIAAATASRLSGGTIAQQQAAATAAATEANTAATAGARTAQGSTYSKYIGVTEGGSGVSAAGTLSVPADLARSGDIAAAAASTNAKLDTIKDELAPGTSAVMTGPLPNLHTAGALTSKTMADAFSGFKNRVVGSGIIAAASGFFNVTASGGACPVWSSDIPMIGVLTFDHYCRPWFQDMLPWIRGVLLLIFSVVAFRIAIL